MKVTKIDLQPIDMCYGVSVMERDGVPHVFFASEAKDGACVSYKLPELENGQTIWTEPGGCMSMVPVPGRKDEFFAIQKFYRLWDWEGAELVWVRPDGKGGYAVKTMAVLPYLHRFDFLERDGSVYLIACTVAAHKKELADWSRPGAVHVAKLPADLNNGLRLTTLRNDFFKNHGYAHIEWNGNQAGFVTCHNGAFVFTPPTASGSSWTIEQLMDEHISDADMIDIDGDGEMEIATIEEFHGDKFRIYKKIDGRYQMVFQHPEIADFYHVVKRATLAGKPGFVGGGRMGKKQLFFVCPNNAKDGFDVHTLDEGFGPSNAAITYMDGYALVCAANRECGQAAVYRVEP